MPDILSSAADLKFLSEGEISIKSALRMDEVSSRMNQMIIDDPDLVKSVKHIQDQKILADIVWNYI